MEKITITINNKSIETVSGKTILEVVREHKLDNIPTLCHDDRIEPYGSCFLCVVEVQGLNRLVPSCATPVSNGMVITTDNGKIRESRKTALELLLSNHYADCVGPCMNNCPANVDAQGYVALIAQGRYEDALKLIKEKNPLPLSIGRVCVRDCELECRRKHIDEPVAINYLKRFVADIDDVKWHPPVKADNGKKVAIIGGGPSGLTCAYYLRKEGYGVKIFEKLPKLGGMLRYGIPEYRLPKDILDKEINWITGLGIEVETGVEMGKDFSTEQLLKEGYNSVYLAVGAHKASKMGLNDEDTIKNVFGGIDFLRELTMDGAPRLKGTVVIVGGGNTAIDAARTALRCGADKVKLVYRRTVKEMPAHHEEISAAQHEGVDMVFLTLPKSIISENGKLKGIECMRMELRDAGDGKRPRPVPVEGSEYIIDCDYLIGAIGQAVDTSFLEKDKSCTLSEWNTIEVKTETFETSIPGVFAGGDVVSGPFTAVSSIGHGRIAAEAIMSYLGTGKAVAKAKKFYSFKHKLTEIPVSEFSHFQKLDRKRMAELPAETRIHNFDEVELGLTEEQSGEETFRCLECGCSDYNECSLRKYADDFQIDISKYIGETRKYKVDTRHPFIALDSNKCINCGKCVRTCSGILKVSALGFVYRGFKAVVKPAMEKALSETNCIACGNCIDVCPTGAITEKFPFKVLGTLEKENHETVCNFCSIGCKVNFKVINNDILYAGNDTESVKNSLNRGYLCVKGRFGHRYLLNRDRINLPVIRNGKTEKNLGWTEAYSEAAGRIGDIVKKYGPDSVAIFASPKLSNEELYLLQKFGRKTIGTNNLYSFHYLLNESRPDEMDEITGITTSTASIQDIAGADVIVAINSNLNEENLVMEMSIKEAQKKGAFLVVVNSSEIKLTKYADLWIDAQKGSNTALMAGIINEVIDSNAYDAGFVNQHTENFTALKGMVSVFDKKSVVSHTGLDNDRYNQLIGLLNKPDANIVFIYNIDSVKEKSGGDLKAITNFLVLTNRIQKKNNGIYLMRDFVNSSGMMDMGMNPYYLPGHVRHDQKKDIAAIAKAWGVNLEEVFKPVEIKEKLLNNSIKAVLVFGEDPLMNEDNYRYFQGLEFLMVCDTHSTDTAKAAQMVFPLRNFTEQDGTVTSGDNNIQPLKAFISRENQPENWKIISELANNMGENFAYASNRSIFAEIQKINRFYEKTGENGIWSNDLFRDGFFLDGKKARFSTFTVDFSAKYAEKPVVHFSESFYRSRIKGKITQ